MQFKQANYKSHLREKRDAILLYVSLGISAIFMGTAVAYLIVNGQWQIALGLLFVIPGFILIHRYPFAALLIWLLLNPFLVATDGGILRRVYWIVHRMLPPATVVIIVLSHMLKIHKRKFPRLGFPELMMVGYIGVTMLSVLYNSDQIQATIYFLYDHIVIPMCLYLIIRLTKPNERDMKRLMPVLLFILLSQSFIGLMSWIAPQVLPAVWIDRAGGATRTTGSLDSYSVFSSTMIFCGLLLLQSGLNYNRSKIIGWGLVASFFLAIFMVFFSFSRGSWLGAIFVLGGLIFLYPRFVLRLGFITVLFTVIVIRTGLLDSYITLAQNRLSSETADESALSRLPVMLGALRMFESKPVFGWGYEDFDQYDYHFQERVGDLVSPDKDHASHNVYLTVLAEQGMVGFLFYLLPVFWWLAMTVKALPKMPSKGFWSRKLLVMFWLVLVFIFVVNNFSNMRVVFGLGLWWITLGFIGTMVESYLTPEPTKNNAKFVLPGLIENSN